MSPNLASTDYRVRTCIRSGIMTRVFPSLAIAIADMRGNTDESWARTLDWLVRNRLLVPGNGVDG